MYKDTFLKIITEGSSDIFVYKNKEKNKGPGLVEKGLPFYNPSMELNRDLSIIVLEHLIKNSKNPLKILDGLSASGIRGVRFANEISGNFTVYINDWNKESYDLIKKNIKENSLKNAVALNKNLNTILSEEKFDYIDIDPFGSPVYFFDSAVRSIKHNGIIAATATDTAALCGVYPKVCIRRYDAQPFHCTCMKEVGIRILIGCLARNANRYDKGIVPILSYTTDHYFRIYVSVYNNTTEANKTREKVNIIPKGKMIGIDKTEKEIGPLYTGKIQKKQIFPYLRSILSDKNLGTKNILWNLLDNLEFESDANMFFYTSDSLSKYFKTSPPKKKDLFNFLQKKSYKVVNTHFDPAGFKTNAPFDIIEKMFK